MDGNKKVLTVKELAQELGISINLAYRQVKEGNIYSIKCGDRYLIPIKAFEQLLAGAERTGTGRAVGAAAPARIGGGGDG